MALNWTHYAAIALWILTAIVDYYGFKRIVKGAAAAGHPDQSIWVIQGFRRLILGGGLMCFGFALWFDMRSLYVLGAVFLLEEAVETQVQGWAARRGKKKAAERS